MDFKDVLKTISERITKIKEQIKTEESTKTALVLPFIQALGYDIFNPIEVMPEYNADIGENMSGLKKGEKVDYAIIKDGLPIVLVECKKYGERLDLHNDQLFRYFHTSKARFGILTNGSIYKFFTDLDEANKMDTTPFLEIDMENLKDTAIEEVKKFQKSYFNTESIVESASELKYNSQIKTIFMKQMNEPDEQFTKYFASQVYNGRLTEKTITQFNKIVKKSISQCVTEIVNDRLNNALIKESVEQVQEEVVEEQSKIVTTQEEIDAFLIIKSIIRKHIEVERIFYRDAQTYCAILLDNNNRKTICRLWLNGQKKFISFIDEDKKDIKHEITTIDDIYKHEERIIMSLTKLN